MVALPTTKARQTRSTRAGKHCTTKWPSLRTRRSRPPDCPTPPRPLRGTQSSTWLNWTSFTNSTASTRLGSWFNLKHFPWTSRLRRRRLWTTYNTWSIATTSCASLYSAQPTSAPYTGNGAPRRGKCLAAWRPRIRVEISRRFGTGPWTTNFRGSLTGGRWSRERQSGRLRRANICRSMTICILGRQFL